MSYDSVMGYGIAASRASGRQHRSLGSRTPGRWLWAPLMVPLLSLACSSSPRSPAQGVDLAEVVEPPFTLTDEMKAWVHERVSIYDPREARLQALLFALRQDDRGGLKIEYQRGYTGTATEVFKTKQGNCLSFTHLFVGMARELDVPAYYVQVPRIERYNSGGDLVVLSRHVTAGYGAGPDRLILELLADASSVAQHDVRPLSDRRAAALHYSNRGAELLQKGRSGEAVGQLDIALELADDLPSTWTNLGVARRRQGDFEGAERAYRRAIALDPGSVPAYSNLATLLELRGERDAAGEILRLLDHRKNRNPFTFLALGDTSLRHGQHEEARRYFRRAYRLDSDLAETRAAMGMMALAVGKTEEAREWLRKAVAIEPGSSWVVRLERDLERASPDPQSKASPGASN